MKSNYILTLLLSCIVFTSCRNDSGSFDNKVFIDGKASTSQLLVKAGVNSFTRTLTAAIAQPYATDVTVNYAISQSKVAKYNRMYEQEALILPEEYYTLSANSGNIIAGTIKADDVTLQFTDLDQLDREEVYVLPVSITKSNMDILISDDTKYYVIKGASLINVVGDIEENYLTIDWQDPSVVNNLSELTLEALIRCRNYDRQISTVMGIEGSFLIRLGDAGYPSNQIQIATSGGNFPSADSNKGLPTNEWIHIALTYNSTSGESVLYVNGKEQGSRVKSIGDINLGRSGTGGFCIGRSYADERYLAGEISEVRIWNKVRTIEEIVNNPYYVSPDSEGLVAYWKFDDKSTFRVKDYSGNGNDALANSELKWTPVELPESTK